MVMRTLQQPDSMKSKTVYLHLTKKCNLNCTYCYFNAGEAMESELSLDVLESLFRDVVLLRPQKLTFTGGEPLLRSDLFDIAQLFRSIDVDKQTNLCLISNGTLVTRENAIRIARAFDEIRISIDGPEDINDRLRGKGSYHKAMTAIQQLLEAGIHPSVSITVTVDNSSCLPSFLSFLLEEIFITDFHLTPFRPVGRGAQHPELAYPWNEARSLILQFWQKHFGTPSLLKKADDYTLRNCGTCGVGTYLNIHPNGDVYPCHVLSVTEFLLGNVKRSSLLDIYQNSPLFKRLRNLDFTTLFQTSEHLRLLLANAVCLGEVYRDNRQEIDDLIKRDIGRTTPACTHETK